MSSETAFFVRWYVRYLSMLKHNTSVIRHVLSTKKIQSSPAMNFGIGCKGSTHSVLHGLGNKICICRLHSNWDSHRICSLWPQL